MYEWQLIFFDCVSRNPEEDLNANYQAMTPHFQCAPRFSQAAMGSEDRASLFSGVPLLVPVCSRNGQLDCNSIARPATISILSLAVTISSCMISTLSPRPTPFNC